jgi:hypothetical protein
MNNFNLAFINKKFFFFLDKLLEEKLTIKQTIYFTI